MEGNEPGAWGDKKKYLRKRSGARRGRETSQLLALRALVWVARPIAAALQAFERFYRERGPGGREGKAGSGLGGPDNGRCGRPTFPDLQPSPAGRGKCDSHKRPPPVATSSSGSGCSSLPCYHPAVKNDRHGGSQTNVFSLGTFQHLRSCVAGMHFLSLYRNFLFFSNEAVVFLLGGKKKLY